MRKKIHEITDVQEIEAILAKCRIGRFATVDKEGYPYIVPLNFVYWNKAIYFHCARTGEKLDNLFASNKVGFEVDAPLAYLDSGYFEDRDPCGVTQFYQSVIIRGRAEIIMEMEEKLGALNALVASHEQGQPVEITQEMDAVNKCSVVAIRIDSMSCKANYAQSKKEEEKKKLGDYLKKRNEVHDEETAKLILGQ